MMGIGEFCQVSICKTGGNPIATVQVEVLEVQLGAETPNKYSVKNSSGQVQNHLIQSKRTNNCSGDFHCRGAYGKQRWGAVPLRVDVLGRGSIL